MLNARLVLLGLFVILVPASTTSSHVIQSGASCYVGDRSIDWYLQLRDPEQAEFVDRYRKGFELTYEIAKADLKGLFQGQNIETNARLKTPSSIREKIIRKRAGIQPYHCFRDIGDIIGLRIIASNYAAFSDIDHTVKAHFVVDKLDVQISSARNSQYRAVHYDVMLDGRRGEIQLHTRRSTLLADASHTLVYKGPFIDNSDVKDYVAALSFAIHQLDSNENAALPDVPVGLPQEAKECFAKLLARLNVLSVAGPFDSTPVCSN